MTRTAHAAGDVASDLQDYRPLFPFATLKAVGQPVFRSLKAREYACLMDLDPEVITWRSFTRQIGDDIGDRRLRHHVDFMVETSTERLMVEVGELRCEDPEWLENVLSIAGYRYQNIQTSDLNPIRVQNARDLVRYARYEAALGDRVRVLAALNGMGSLPLAECLTAVWEGRAMETIAALILRGHVEVDLDESLLGADTLVRLCTR